MSPKFITHLTSIFLFSDLEKIRESSVCLYVSALLTSEDITEMKNLEERMKNAVSTMKQSAGQHLPFQSGGINWALNVLISTATKTLGGKRPKNKTKLAFFQIALYCASL